MNTAVTIMNFILSAISSIGFTIVFLIAYRHTRLLGFRFLFLTSAAGLTTWLIQTAATPFLFRFFTVQEATHYFLGFRCVSLAIEGAQIAALFILARQYFASNRVNTALASA